MPVQKPVPLDKAFVLPGTSTFGQLIVQLHAHPDVSETRKRDMISGLRRVADALGLPPEDVPCSGRWLQPRIAQINAPSIGMKTKTWQNAISNARAAMRQVEIVERRNRNIKDLDQQWRPLWEAVIASRNKSITTALPRFVHFLNRMGVHPDEVRDEHAIAFRDAVTLNEISRDPERTYRAAITSWRLASRCIDGWPQAQLTLPDRTKRIALEETAFPTSFIAELDHVLNRLVNPDPLDDMDPAQPRSLATVRLYRYQLLRFASHLVYAGVDAAAITSLSVMLDPDMAKKGVRRMLNRNDGKISRDIAQTARLLCNMARRTQQPEAQHKALAALAAKVNTPQHNGMTEKNRARLRILQEPRNQHRLLDLPDQIFKTHGSTTERMVRNALAREDAVAIAILLVCPIRVGNLAALQLGRHIQRPGDGRAFLVLSQDDTKNSRAVEFELPSDVITLIDRHLATRVPHRCPPACPFLFPRRDGRTHIEGGELGTRLAKRIRNETGLEMNAHLFRHFAVMTWLDANPGSYEVARRLLGHSELSHTLNMYSGLEVTSATRAFSDLVADMRRATVR